MKYRRLIPLLLTLLLLTSCAAPAGEIDPSDWTWLKEPEPIQASERCLPPSESVGALTEPELPSQVDSAIASTESAAPPTETLPGSFDPVQPPESTPGESESPTESGSIPPDSELPTESESDAGDRMAPAESTEIPEGQQRYVVNTNTKKFHLPSCSSVDTMKEENKRVVTCTREELIEEGYAPCKRCNP